MDSEFNQYCKIYSSLRTIVEETLPPAARAVKFEHNTSHGRRLMKVQVSIRVLEDIPENDDPTADYQRK